MTVFAIADLHLSVSVPEKDMKVFGPKWTHYMERIADHWNALVKDKDLVLIPGDISWAMKLEEAIKDLEWIEALPGTKVMIRGNHDYWWSSPSKVRSILPPSIHIIHNDAFDFEGISIAGTRFWDSPEFDFLHYVNADLSPQPVDEKIFRRELGRLELSLKSLNRQAKKRIVMTHYPPISADLKSSSVSQLLEDYHVDYCLFGHLHNLKEGLNLFGEKNGVHYMLTAADYLDFCPRKVFEY